MHTCLHTRDLHEHIYTHTTHTHTHVTLHEHTHFLSATPKHVSQVLSLLVRNRISVLYDRMYGDFLA